MSNETPWSSAETLSRLSSEKIGTELSTLVAEKLQSDAGGRGLWHQHRDYCGHGLIYREGQFRLVEVRDGIADDGELVKAWDSTESFVAWLAQQSDYSLSGSDESEPDLHTESPFALNNQRITRAGLRDYVHDCPEALAPFRDFLIALDLEFRFLVEKHGFSKIRPRMDGRECVVRYRKASAAAVTVATEFQSTPFITITSYAGKGEEPFSDASLVGVAQDRIPGWRAPEIPAGQTSEAAYRRYFRVYAELLEQHFSDLLLPEEDDSTATSPPGRVGSAGRPESPTSEKGQGTTRVQGTALAGAAFLVLVAELRYFYGSDLPTATGSLRGNLGILILLSLPWLLLAIGLLQAISGFKLRALNPAFSTLPVTRRLALGFATIAMTVVATWLAALLS